jgi:hypothetical protein
MNIGYGPTYKFVPSSVVIQEPCNFIVHPAGIQVPMCFTDDKKKATLISAAMSYFLNSKTGEEWLKKHKV